MRGAWWALALGAACAPAPGERADTASTEVDVVTAEDSLVEPPQDPAFQLAGTEPFWGLRIDGEGLRFTTPEDTTGRRFPLSRAVMYGDTLRWNSIDSSGTSLEVVVVAATCSDGMSDTSWSHTARVQLGQARYEGCAEPRPARRE